MHLNWPEVALLLGVVAVVVFRAPLSRLIERTEKVKDWLVAPKQPTVPASADLSLPTRSPSDEQKAIEKLTAGFNSQLLLMQENAVRAELAQHQLSAETATEKVLLRHLAGTQIALHFERTYAVIYRSQLQALRWLRPDFRCG